MNHIKHKCMKYRLTSTELKIVKNHSELDFDH